MKAVQEVDQIIKVQNQAQIILLTQIAIVKVALKVEVVRILVLMIHQTQKVIVNLVQTVKVEVEATQIQAQMKKSHLNLLHLHFKTSCNH